MKLEGFFLALSSGRTFHTFRGKEVAELLPKTWKEQQEYNLTDDSCFLRISAIFNICLYHEFAEE